jgi:Flp pilus assembly protein TadB
MTASSNSPPRDADGRFVKRRRNKSSTSSNDIGSSGEVRHRGRNAGLGQIATLTLAIILGVAGFAFAVFWIGALVLLGILWGTMAVEHQQQSGRTKGVLAEVVEVVVGEAKDVAGSARDTANESTGS